MISPPFLNSGDAITIIAPAGKVLPHELASGVQAITDAGFSVALSKHLYSNSHAYLSATDSERLEDMQAALDAPSVRAIFCARGGYGTTRIIDQLNWDAFQQNPKWIVGFSDITALHSTLAEMGYESIHGTMPKLISSIGDVSFQSLLRVIQGKPYEIAADYSELNKAGEANGVTIGGNLALLVDAIGTRSDIDFSNRILVLEEIGEYIYRIDRMLHQLKRAGKLASLKGLVIGQMSDVMETTRLFGESIEEIITNVVGEYHYPVAFQFPIGHGQPNFAWRHGSEMSLVVSHAGSLLTSTS